MNNINDYMLIYIIALLILSYELAIFQFVDYSIVIMYFLLLFLSLSVLFGDSNPYYELYLMCVATMAHFIYIISIYSNLHYYCIIIIIIIALPIFKIIINCVMLLIKEYDEEKCCKLMAFVNIQ